MKKTMLIVVSLLWGLGGSPVGSLVASEGISLDLFKETGIFTGYLYEIRGNEHLSANYKSVLSYKETVFVASGGGVNPSVAQFIPVALIVSPHHALYHLGLQADWLAFTKAWYVGYSLGYNATTDRFAHGPVVSIDLLKLFGKNRETH